MIRRRYQLEQGWQDNLARSQQGLETACARLMPQHAVFVRERFDLELPRGYGQFCCAVIERRIQRLERMLARTPVNRRKRLLAKIDLMQRAITALMGNPELHKKLWEEAQQGRTHGWQELTDRALRQ